MTLQKQIIWAGRCQWLLAAAMVALAGGFYSLAYRPETEKLAHLRDQIAQTQRDLDDCQAQTKALSGVEAEVAKLEQKLKEFKALPAQLEWAQFIKDIGSIEKMASLKNFDSESKGDLVRHDRLCEKPIKFAFEGDFVNVYSFLRHAEELPRLTRIPTLTIERKDKDGPGNVKVTMTMEIYCLAE